MPQAQDTIREDVPSFEVEAKPEVIEIDVPEDQAMSEDDPRAAIYKKHAEQRKSDGEGVIIGTESEAGPEAKPAEIVDEEISVKVNGKERKVHKSKVEAAGGIDAYQKNAAASELLNQASAKARQLAEYEANLAAREQRIQQAEQQTQQRASPATLPDEGAMKQLAGKYHEAMLDGDIDTANTLLIQLQAARGATPDAEAIARRAVADVRAEFQREQQAAQQERFNRGLVEAKAKFEDEYSDIASDPELFNMTDAKTLEIYQQHPDWEPQAIIDTAAKQVREWFSGKVGTSAPSDKLAAKRAQTTVRGGSAKAIPRQAPPPQTKSQYVDSLRKARGLE